MLLLDAAIATRGPVARHADEAVALDAPDACKVADDEGTRLHIGDGSRTAVRDDASVRVHELDGSRALSWVVDA